MDFTSTPRHEAASGPPILSRAFAFVAGAVIIAAAAHAVVDASGGYGTSHALLVWAAAVAVLAGACAIPHASLAWGSCLAVGLLFGELYALANTAERAVAQREALQAPIRAAGDNRTAADRRLDAALEAQRQANADAVSKAAERDCRDRCVALLESAKADAAGEVAAARAALAALPVAGSATPMADRLGIDPAVYDVTVGALASLAANGLGGVLVAFGAHGPIPRRRTAAERRRDDLERARAFFDMRPLIQVADEPEVGRTVREHPSRLADDPPTPPRGPGKSTRRPGDRSNVLAFPHPVIKALEAAGGTVASNQELAQLMGVTEGESTKRVAEVAHLLAFRREGKRIVISLREAAVA